MTNNKTLNETYKEVVTEEYNGFSYDDNRGLPYKGDNDRREEFNNITISRSLIQEWIDRLEFIEDDNNIVTHVKDDMIDYLKTTR